MNDEAANAQKVIRKDITRIAVSVVPMFMLLWTIYTGFKFATKPNRDEKYNHYAFSIGVVTIVLGLTYVTIGLAIVADLALNLTSRLHREEKRIDIQQARDRKTIYKDIVCFIVTVILILMLLWATYTGFRLATETRPDGKYNHLAFSIGVVTIAFGSIYFIIGLTIVADLALNLSHMLKQNKNKQQQQQQQQQQKKKKKKEADIYSCSHADNNCIV